MSVVTPPLSRNRGIVFSCADRGYRVLAEVHSNVDAPCITVGQVFFASYARGDAGR